MTALENYFTELSGKVVLECSLCHHETREHDTAENHAFDCSRDGRVNDRCKEQPNVE